MQTKRVDLEDDESSTAVSRDRRGEGKERRAHSMSQLCRNKPSKPAPADWSPTIMRYINIKKSSQCTTNKKQNWKVMNNTVPFH